MTVLDFLATYWETILRYDVLLGMVSAALYFIADEDVAYHRIRSVTTAGATHATPGATGTAAPLHIADASRGSETALLVRRRPRCYGADFDDAALDSAAFAVTLHRTNRA